MSNALEHRARSESALLQTAIGVWLTAVGVAGCTDEAGRGLKEFQQQPKLLVAVIGDGVRRDVLASDLSKRAPIQAYSPNRSQGYAMWEGVKAAYEAPSQAQLRTLVNLERFDDGGDQDQARRFAATISADPRYLAVIGHATSGTTRAAIPEYTSKRLPLLMPIATAPGVLEENGTASRADNLFRLPPDDRIQASAIAQVIADHRDRASQARSPFKVFFVGDYTSSNNAAYTEFLHQEIRSLVSLSHTREARVGSAYLSATAVADQVRAERPSLVVFSGYGTIARDLIAALRDSYGRERPLPDILLTDGGRVPDLTPDPFRVYLTFPSPPADRCPSMPSDPTDSETLRNVFEQSADKSYQTYGYDALSLISAAALACSTTEITRACLVDQLNNLSHFRAACHQYSFARGDNVLGMTYYLYEAKTEIRAGQTRTVYVFSTAITSAQIINSGRSRQK